jgi:hypothetical protein
VRARRAIIDRLILRSCRHLPSDQEQNELGTALIIARRARASSPSPTT